MNDKFARNNEIDSQRVVHFKLVEINTIIKEVRLHWFR